MTLALVCTNDTYFGAALKITLERAGYSVVLQNGDESESALPLDASSFALIDLNGEANLGEAIVMTREQHPDALVLYLTPFSMQYFISARNEIVLEKPFSPNELLLSVEELLTRAPVVAHTQQGGAS